MKNNFDALTASILTASAFYEKYKDQLADFDGIIQACDEKPLLLGYGRDAALFGETFGRSGWTRELGYSGRDFNWNKEVDGVRVAIYNAEKCDLNNTPVPEKAFPVLIKDAVVTNSDDDIPF
jgi:hypothetical protein